MWGQEGQEPTTVLPSQVPCFWLVSRDPNQLTGLLTAMLFGTAVKARTDWLSHPRFLLVTVPKQLIGSWSDVVWRPCVGSSRLALPSRFSLVRLLNSWLVLAATVCGAPAWARANWLSHPCFLLVTVPKQLIGSWSDVVWHPCIGSSRLALPSCFSLVRLLNSWLVLAATVCGTPVWARADWLSHPRFLLVMLLNSGLVLAVMVCGTPVWARADWLFLPRFLLVRLLNSWLVLAAMVCGAPSWARADWLSLPRLSLVRLLNSWFVLAETVYGAPAWARAPRLSLPCFLLVRLLNSWFVLAATVCGAPAWARADWLSLPRVWSASTSFLMSTHPVNSVSS